MWIIEATIKFARVVMHKGNDVRTFKTREEAEEFLIGRVMAGASFAEEWKVVEVAEGPLPRSVLRARS